MLKILFVSALTPGLILIGWQHGKRTYFFLHPWSAQFCRFLSVLQLFFIVLSICVPLDSAFADTLEEYSVKTALVFNLAIFTQWPEGVSTDSNVLNLCVIGDNVVQQAFTSLSDKAVGERSLNIIDIQRSRKINGCQIIFIGTQDRIELAQIHAAAAGKPILTVDDLNGFNTFRGVVNLQKVGGRMRLNINLELAQSAQLKISSRLLKLATIVSAAQ